MNKAYKVLLLLSLTFLLSGGVLGVASCGGDGECLSNGENCSSAYIDENYGGNRPGCCNGGDICQSSPNGFLTCN